MRKVIVFTLAALAMGSLVSQVQAAPATGPASADRGDVVNVGFFCGPGRHLGPLGYCRPNAAPPLFRLRCPIGFHRNLIGRCVINR